MMVISVFMILMMAICRKLKNLNSIEYSRTKTIEHKFRPKHFVMPATIFEIQGKIAQRSAIYTVIQGQM
jgi:hypothetical protein